MFRLKTKDLSVHIFHTHAGSCVYVFTGNAADYRLGPRLQGLVLIPISPSDPLPVSNTVPRVWA